MDPTPLQQTVMEPAEVISSIPQEEDPTPCPNSPSASPDICTPQNNADQAYEPLSYDEVVIFHIN